MAGYTDAWGTALLRRLGAPVNAENLRFLNAWARAEGGRATNNPFNTTQQAPGATNLNRAGVKNYATPAQGLTATAQTLTNGHYGPIVDSLRAGKPATDTAAAVAATPWGTGTGVQRVLGVTPGPNTGAGAGAPASTPSNAPRSGAAAASWALAQVGKPNKPDTCLGFVATSYGLQGSGLPAGKNDTAAGFWAQAQARHAPDPRPPAGALVFLKGRNPQGHVAVSVGGGNVVSTDYPKRGRVGLTSISKLSSDWNMTYVGWTPGQFPAGAGKPTGGNTGPLVPINGGGVTQTDYSTGTTGSSSGLLPFPNPIDAAGSAISSGAQAAVGTVLQFVLYAGMVGLGGTLMLVGLVLLALATKAGKDVAAGALVVAAPEAAPAVAGELKGAEKPAQPLEQPRAATTPAPTSSPSSPSSSSLQDQADEITARRRAGARRTAGESLPSSAAS